MPTLPHPCGEELDLFRSLYCAAVAAILAFRLRHHLRFVRARGGARRCPRFLGVMDMPRLGQLGASVVGGVLMASLVASAALPSPAALALAGLSSLLYFAQIIELPEIRRKANTVPVILGLLAVSTSVRQATGAWFGCAPLLLVEIVVVQIYSSAGLAKLRTAGLRWVDGRTLRSWLVYYHLRDGNRAALALASREGACRLASLAMLMFELTFWVVIPFPALTAPYVAAALAFHLGTAMLMRIHYWLFLGPAYLVFVAPLLRHAL